MAQIQEEIVLGKTLFGYDRDEVDKYLDELNDTHNDKLKEIKNKIIHFKIENTRIKKEIEELKNQIEEQMKSDEFMSYAQDKAEELIPVMSKHVSNQVNYIEEVYKEQEKIFDIKIEEFDRTIKNTQGQLNSLLKAVLAKSESFDETVKTFMDEKSSYKEMMNRVSETKLEIEKPASAGVNKEIHEAADEEYTNNYAKVEFWDSEEEAEIEDYKEIEVTETEQLEDIREDTGSNNIRYRYLIGKIVGQDITDSSNAVIVQQDSLITSEIVEKVEAEGKLAELVINMKMPDVNI
jgi:DivIVA domain-containing protein